MGQLDRFGKPREQNGPGESFYAFKIYWLNIVKSGSLKLVLVYLFFKFVLIHDVPSIFFLCFLQG